MQGPDPLSWARSLGEAILQRTLTDGLRPLLRCAMLQGREQEWNISRGELAELVALGVMNQQEVEECISSGKNIVHPGL